MTTENAILEKRFHAAMAEIYRRAKTEAGYNATRFLQMVAQQGGHASAKQLLHAGATSDGFTALYLAGRLDLTVEALVLRPEYEPLFTDDERRIARDRLAKHGHVEQ